MSGYVVRRFIFLSVCLFVCLTPIYFKFPFIFNASRTSSTRQDLVGISLNFDHMQKCQIQLREVSPRPDAWQSLRLGLEKT